MYSLENQGIRIVVHGQGAELQSIYDKAADHEWLWQGDSRWWGKRAPVLFPFIGCVKEGKYVFNGQSFPMSKHGFARDKAFDLISQTSSELVFSLQANEDSKVMYPFDFELRLIYRLSHRGVTVTHQVLNHGSDTLWFSLGGHPAFNCPMDEETWLLEFEQNEELASYGVNQSNGLILPDKKIVPLKDRCLELNSTLFKEDALIFENLNSNSVLLKRADGTKSMKFHFEGFPFLALWSPMGPFLCLEPWFGMADSIDHSGNLTEKQGVVSLEAGHKFECSFAVQCVN